MEGNGVPPLPTNNLPKRHLFSKDIPRKGENFSSRSCKLLAWFMIESWSWSLLLS